MPKYHVRQPYMAHAGVYEYCVGPNLGAYTRLADAVKLANKHHEKTNDNLVIRHGIGGTIVRSWGTNFDKYAG